MQTEIEAVIQQLEADGRAATLHNDVAVHEHLLAEDWINTNTNGTITTKPQLLRLLETHPFTFVSIDDDDVVIRSYNHIAVVTGRSTRTRIGRDQAHITQRVRFTRVYIQRDGQWKVVGAQATLIPDA